MADIEKPDLTNKWAEEGAVIKPTDAKIRLGWTSEVPPHQWQNWWQQRVDSSLSYSLQKGIPEWDEEAEYIANKSFVQLGGDIYKCIQTNTGENPSSKPAYWKPLREVYSEELELGSASRVDMGTGGSQIRTNTQNDSRYIQGGSVTQSTGSSTTDVMSQKAVTDALNTKADKSTTISAGIGLEGGGNLSANRTLSVDFGTTAGKVAQGNDSRIVNALQKGNNLSDVTSPATARSNLGLKGAATRDVVSSPTDASGSNKLVTQGWMGLGLVNRDYRTVDQEGLDNLAHSGFFYVNRSNNNLPGHATVIPLSANGDKTWNPQLAVHTSGTRTEMYLRSSDGQGVYHDWQEIHHTGNILKTTGNNDNFPMSQKAVSDQLLGVGQTWQDMAGNRAFDVTYTNTTGRAIIVSVVGRSVEQGASSSIAIIVDGLEVDFCQITNDTDSPKANAYPNVSAVVPSGSSYYVEFQARAASIHRWMELR